MFNKKHYFYIVVKVFYNSYNRKYYTQVSYTYDTKSKYFNGFEKLEKLINKEFPDHTSYFITNIVEISKKSYYESKNKEG